MAFGFVFEVMGVPGAGSVPDAVGDFSNDDLGPGVAVEEVAGLVAFGAGFKVHGGDDVVAGVAWAGDVEAFVLCVDKPGAWFWHGGLYGLVIHRLCSFL